MAERRDSLSITRRELLAGASFSAATALLASSNAQAQPVAGSPVVFAHTTVVTPDATQDDVALAVAGDRIAAIGPTDRILQQFLER